MRMWPMPAMPEMAASGIASGAPVTSTTPRTSIMHTVTTRPTLYTM